MSAVNMTIHLTRRCYLAYRLRAKLHASQGRIQQAIDDCNASIDYYKVDEDTFILRGDLFVEQEKYEAAIEDYLAAARIEPKSTLPHLKCGLAHFLAGNIEEVGKCRDLAVRANPADAHPYRTLGKEMLSKGSRDEAIRCFSVSIALNPRDPEARAARGNAFKDMGNAKKAAADFQKAEELKKGQRGAQRNGN